MKRYLLVLTLFLILLGCEKNELERQPAKLTNCAAGYLLFYDNMYALLNCPIVFPPDSGQSMFSYEYENNKITSVRGGFIPIPSGSNFSRQAFSQMAYDSIVYSANDVYLYPKFDVGNGIKEKQIHPTIFSLGPKNELIKVVRETTFQSVLELFYTYLDNQIIETDGKGNVRRTFHFENENLTKITSQFENAQGDLLSKEEILFQGYDDNPNPFRNLYFITGAFYRAFSKNNYRSYTMNEYGLLNDGSFALLNSYWHSLSIRYNSENYPMFGDYQ